jgi:hypothetical protein
MAIGVVVSGSNAQPPRSWPPGAGAGAVEAAHRIGAGERDRPASELRVEVDADRPDADLVQAR